MTTIVLFHHAAGLTDGVRALADRLAQAGYLVITPDLYGGHRFTTIEEGMSFYRELTHEQVLARVQAAVAALTGPFVVAGVSLGAMVAQILAQTDARAQGLLALEGFVDPGYLPGALPDSFPVAIHGGDADTWFAEDAPASLDYTRASATAHCDLYEGADHLFTDASWPTYVPEQANLVVERALAWLATLPEHAREGFSLPTADEVGEYGEPGPLRDQLVKALVSGQKTATSSLHRHYLDAGEALPTVGQTELVIDSAGRPVCLLEISRVDLVRAQDVTDDFVRAEGEGFDTWDEWWSAHQSFWSEGDEGIPVTPEDLVVCQWLRLIAL